MLDMISYMWLTFLVIDLEPCPYPGPGKLLSPSLPGRARATRLASIGSQGHLLRGEWRAYMVTGQPGYC